MKIAIPSETGNIDGNVSERFARAEYFIVYDTEKGEYTVLDNSGLGAHGAGPRTIQMLASEGVDAVILPGIGQKAFEALVASGMKAFFAKPGSVKDNLDMYERGELEEIKAPTKGGRNRFGWR